jgi:hypothetical protein
MVISVTVYYDILQVYGNYATIRESYTKMPVISPLKGSNTLYLEKGQLVVYSKWSIALPLTRYQSRFALQPHPVSYLTVTLWWYG